MNGYEFIIILSHSNYPKQRHLFVTQGDLFFRH